MTIGGLYMQYEEMIDRVLRRFIHMALIVYLGILIMAEIYGMKLRMIGLSGEWNLFGLIAIVCGIILLVALCKRIRPNKMLSYIGKNSIVFYFLSGVIPAMLGAIAHQLFADQSYGITLIITTIGVACGLMATYVIKRYLPYMVDLRVLFKK
jgi:surface polysaccharide O-acyltransferase-like enzyme